MYGRSRVSVKVERGLTFTFTRGLSYIASISFMHVNVTCVRTEKLRVSANQPLPSRARRNTQSNTKRENTVRETGERKSNVLSCFYTCFLILSFFFCQPGFHAPCRRLLVCFFFFFGATLRYIDRGRNHKSNWKTKDQPFPWKFVLTLPNSLTVQRPTLLHCKIRLPTTRSSLTSVIYKCRYLFSDSKTMATPVNYTCKSFIKLAPDKFKAPSTRI